MNYLKKIYLPEKNVDCIAIFYESITNTGVYKPGKAIPEENIEKQNHCEMFTKSDLQGIGLNKDSFVIRFPNRKNNRKMRFKITHQKEQIDVLAEMAEICFGGGLRVIEHYSKLGYIDNHRNKEKSN